MEKNKKNWIKDMIQREATPKPERTDTVEQFCELRGIDTSTYWYQARKKENKKEIVRIWLNEASAGGHEVLQKLRENALQGKEKSIEMYLKFVLELAENLDIKTDGEKLSTGVTDTELNAILDRYVQKQRNCEGDIQKGH